LPLNLTAGADHNLAIVSPQVGQGGSTVSCSSNMTLQVKHLKS